MKPIKACSSLAPFTCCKKMGVAHNAELQWTPHALRVGHSRRLDPPTKGPTAGTRALPSNLTWARARVTMPVWVTPRGGCQLCHPRQDMAWGERASGQIRTGVWQLRHQMGSAGISFILFHGRGWDWKRQREGAGHSFWGGGVGGWGWVGGGREIGEEAVLGGTKRHLPITRGEGRKADSCLK